MKAKNTVLATTNTAIKYLVHVNPNKKMANVVYTAPNELQVDVDAVPKDGEANDRLRVIDLEIRSLL
jgi:uncharacterized protein YggU (UPF0235/DUF167 family)